MHPLKAERIYRHCEAPYCCSTSKGQLANTLKPRDVRDRGGNFKAKEEQFAKIDHHDEDNMSGVHSSFSGNHEANMYRTLPNETPLICANGPKDISLSCSFVKRQRTNKSLPLPLDFTKRHNASFLNQVRVFAPNEVLFRVHHRKRTTRTNLLCS